MAWCKSSFAIGLFAVTFCVAGAFGATGLLIMWSDARGGYDPVRDDGVPLSDLPALRESFNIKLGVSWGVTVVAGTCMLIAFRTGRNQSSRHLQDRIAG
jgi:hypothetical protein